MIRLSTKSILFFMNLYAVNCLYLIQSTNLAFRKPVTVDPPEGSCGMDRATSTVDISTFDEYDYYHYGDGDDYVGKETQRVKCASDCGRKYPQSSKVEIIEGTEGDGLELGNIECIPFRKLLQSNSAEYRRKRDSGQECLVKKDTIPSNIWSYSFWMKPDENVTGRVMTVFQHHRFRLTVQKAAGTNYFQATIFDKGVNFAAFNFDLNKWVWFALQVGESFVSYYRKAEGQEPIFSTLLRRNLQRPAYPTYRTIYIGASPQSEKCELLEIMQCRQIGYSQMIEIGSQQGVQPLFPNFSQCPGLTTYEQNTITKYFCSSHYPACDDQGNSFGPCPTLYQEAVSYLYRKCPELLQTDSIWKDQQFNGTGALQNKLNVTGASRNKRQTSPCVEQSTTFGNDIFKGILRDFKYSQSILTTRQFVQTMNGTFPDFYPNNECMCSEDYPASVDLRSDLDLQYCRYIDVQSKKKLRLDAALPNDLRFFSSQYLTDGRLETDDGFWVSTPGMAKVSLTMDFGEVVQVNIYDGVALVLASALPEEAVVLHRFIYGAWWEWYYFAENCSAHGLPDSGVVTSPDGIRCKSYQSLQRGINQNTLKLFTDVTGRPGQYGTVIDKRLEQYFLMERIKFEFRGLPQNTKDSPEQQYHAVTELQIYGKQYQTAKRCDIQCFPVDWGYQGPTVFPTFSRSTTLVTVAKTTAADQETCECQCREPFDRQESGPNCVPYVFEVYPNYGPVIGGTLITLSGALLGNQPPTVTLHSVPDQPKATIPCIVKNSNETRIECVTKGVQTEFVNRSFLVKVGHSQGSLNITAKKLFTYKPDPEISNVYPLVSIVNGGIRLTVIGEHLDSVQNPKMRLRIEYNEVILNYTDYKTCAVESSSIMFCPTPNIFPYLPPEYKNRLNLDHTEINEEFIRVRGRPARSISRYEQLSLVNLVANYMATVGWDSRPKRSPNLPSTRVTDENLKTFPEFKQDNKRTPIAEPLNYVANPPIEEWNPPVKAFKPDWPHNHENIAIAGKRLDEGADAADYFVFIGNEECKVTNLLSNLLTCEPPRSEPGSAGVETQGAALHVYMRVGIQSDDPYTKSLGFLEYHPWWKSMAFIGIMVGAGVFIVFVLVLVCVCYRYRQRSKDKSKQEIDLYYIDAESEISMLNQISPHLRQSIEKSLLKDPEYLQIHKEIGSGNFGKVYSGQCVISDKHKPMHVAVKTIKGGQELESVEQFLEEAVMMENFKHPNILAILGVSFKNNTPYVILPFMTNGDLRSHLKKSTTVVQISDLVIFAIQIAKGMAYLEQNRFIHRDLAARNCMVDLDNTVKVADFGLARDIYVDDYYRAEDRSRALPVRWMAPESMQLGKFTHKSDVWSFGVLMWELMTRGRLPYSGIDNLDVQRFLKRGDRLEKPPATPSKVYKIMKNCWETEPKKRPKFSELVPSLEYLLSQGKNTSKNNMSTPDYVNIPEDYLTAIEAPTEENILNTYRYSYC